MRPHPDGPDAERYGTTVEDGTVHVGTPDGDVAVGDVDRIVELVGGPAWTIEYTERQKRRYPEMDTSDEGLTVDVRDVMLATTHDRAFVETLAAQPDEPADDDDGVSPRLGLFVGRLMSSLQYGID